MTGRKPKQHVDDRQSRALDLEVHWTLIAERHRAAEARYTNKGQGDKATVRREQAIHAEKLTKKHGLAAKHLQLAAARARTARRLNDQASAERVAGAEALAVTTPHQGNLSPKEARRRAKQAEKRARLAREGDAATRRDKKAAQVDHDPRTAAGQRDILIRGPAISKKASLADYGTLIARSTDRRPERLLAMERFDGLVHRSLMGEIPAMKFEKGADVSHTPSDVMNDRAAAHEERDALRADIGREMEAVLFLRIFERRTLTWMESQSMGDASKLGALFLAGIDAAARHFGLIRPSRAVEAVTSRLDRFGDGGQYKSSSAT